MLITSRKNKLILFAHSLRDKRVRDSEGVFFTEGKKLYLEGIESGLLPKIVFVTRELYEDMGDVKGEEIYEVTGEVYEKITDEKAPEGIFAVFEKPTVKRRDGKSAIVLLEGIQDPGNLGTILRSAVAFGFGEAILVRSADPFSPKAVRSTMGGIFKLPIASFDAIEEAVEYAKGKSDKIVATALHRDSKSIADSDTSFATIMIGSEGRGLSERAISLADEKIIIPMENTESLNASVAGAIVMYDSMMKRKDK